MPIANLHTSCALYNTKIIIAKYKRMNNKFESSQLGIPQPPKGNPENICANSEHFYDYPVRIAIQKSGHLSEISRKYFSEMLGCEIPDYSKLKPLKTNIQGAGIVYARNHDVLSLIEQRSVTHGIVGTDQLIESGYGHLLGFETSYVAPKRVSIKEHLETTQAWEIKLLTHKNHAKALAEISTIATSYPVLAQLFLQQIGQQKNIIPITGAVEGIVGLQSNTELIDACIELVVTGGTSTMNELIAWNPAIFEIHPVVIGTAD